MGEIINIGGRAREGNERGEKGEIMREVAGRKEYADIHAILLYSSSVNM